MTDGWTCASCGVSNGPNEVACNACAAPRLRGSASGRQAPRAATTSWQCAACDTVNRGPAAVCSACGASKSDSSAIPTAAGELGSTAVITRTAPGTPAASGRLPSVTIPGDTSIAPGPPESASSATERQRKNIFIFSGIAAAMVALLIGAIVIGTHSRTSTTPGQSLSISPSTNTTTSTSTTTTTTLPVGLASVASSAVPPSPLSTEVALTFSTYFGGINTQDYSQAWSTYTPRYQGATPLGTWETGYTTTQDTTITITSVAQNSDGSVSADVNFTSTQNPSQSWNQEQSCSSWSLTYSLQPVTSAPPIAPGGTPLSYLIDTDQGPEAAAC